MIVCPLGPPLTLIFEKPPPPRSNKSRTSLSNHIPTITMLIIQVQEELIALFCCRAQYTKLARPDNKQSFLLKGCNKIQVRRRRRKYAIFSRTMFKLLSRSMKYQRTKKKEVLFLAFTLEQ